MIETDRALDRDTRRILQKECGPRLQGPIQASARGIAATIERFDPELVLIDASPDWNPAVFPTNKFRESHPLLPVVLLGSPEDTHFERKVLQTGADGWLLKPPRPQELRLLTSLLPKRRGLREVTLNRMRTDALNTLAVAVGKDLFNLLETVEDRLEDLQAAPGSDGASSASLVQALRAACSAKSLSEQILSLAREIKLDPKPLDLAEIVEGAWSRTLQDHRAVAVDVALGPSLHPVHGDRQALEQALKNLLRWAKASTKEPGTVRVRVENALFPYPGVGSDAAFLPAPCVRIEIEGAGALQASEDSWTSRFALLKVQRLVQAHGGFVQVARPNSNTSAVTLYLPVSTAHKEAAKPEPQSQEGIKGRVLVMDDEPALRQLAQAVMKHMGLECDTAAHGEEALSLYKRALDMDRRYDLVVLDLTVRGGVGGISTMAQLLEIDPQAKAIIYTGYSEDPILENYQLYGFKGALRKPYAVQEMVEMVRRILGRNIH
ncbi:response regulator [Desulfacinum hydrothermale]|uniref:response regulator n=1 Tax=Desulfacinum hydrothermale TaxID=109258 RepID=UPI0014833AF0|nr:response regulator [Desulfacinum hydrothermale]